MKTKEQCLDKHVGISILKPYPNVLNAMDEYKNDDVLRAELSFLCKYQERIGLDVESRIDEIKKILDAS